MGNSKFTGLYKYKVLLSTPVELCSRLNGIPPGLAFMRWSHIELSEFKWKDKGSVCFEQREGGLSRWGEEGGQGSLRFQSKS